MIRSQIHFACVSVKPKSGNPGQVLFFYSRLATYNKTFNDKDKCTYLNNFSSTTSVEHGGSRQESIIDKIHFRFHTYI